MKTNGIISVLGGDKRQIFIADLLKSRDYEIRLFGVEGQSDTFECLEENIADADYLLLPVPVSKDGYRLNSEKEVLLMDLVNNLSPDKKVLGGRMPPYLKDHLRAKNVELYDYYENKEYIWKNAEISAEGAVSMLMSESDRVISELRILVCGFGRIGKCLTKKLLSLGAIVTVAARKQEDILQAHTCFGSLTDIIDYRREGTLDLEKKYDVIFNTVPSWIFDKSNISLLENALYIELASAPHGGEAELLRKNCKKYILASGIPGKYAPKSAGAAAFEAICGYLEGRLGL